MAFRFSAFRPWAEILLAVAVLAAMVYTFSSPSSGTAAAAVDFLAVKTEVEGASLPAARFNAQYYPSTTTTTYIAPVSSSNPALFALLTLLAIPLLAALGVGLWCCLKKPAAVPAAAPATYYQPAPAYPTTPTYTYQAPAPVCTYPSYPAPAAAPTYSYQAAAPAAYSYGATATPAAYSYGATATPATYSYGATATPGAYPYGAATPGAAGGQVIVPVPVAQGATTTSYGAGTVTQGMGTYTPGVSPGFLSAAV